MIDQTKYSYVADDHQDMGAGTSSRLTCRDVTERSLPENESLQVCRDWEDTFDTIPDAITIHDASQRIVRANRAAREQFAVPSEPVGEARCHCYYHASMCPPESCVLKEAETTRTAVRRELYLEHLGRHCEFNVLPRFGSDGEFVGTIHVVRDVTACRKLEEQLFHAQKMESIGTLAGGIAHDFNNILTVILGTCSLMEMKLGGQKQLEADLKTVVEAAERAAILTRSLLAFSRKQIFHPEQMDITALVRKMESFFRRVIGEDIELLISCPSLPLYMLADPMQLEQVLMNLVVNAKDAMTEGGTLTIDVAPISLDAQLAASMGCVAGEYLRVAVSDSGCGMDERTRELIFDPFFTTKEVGKGTGLGLAIVYGVIKQHGGMIKTSSKLGEGTTISIYLPLERCTSASAPILQPGLLRGRETILLAEDDAAVRKTNAAILRECGYSVIPASDGADAVEKFTNHKGRIDLVVLDVIMPRMNAQKAYEAIRALDAEVAIVFTSGYTDTAQANALVEQGLHFISKPASIGAFSRRIRELLDTPKGQVER